jgi:endoplasmic reticulum junction formation protein lunapark
VKNKETYKDAVEILQRFGNDRTSFSTPVRSTPASTPVAPNTNSSIQSKSNSFRSEKSTSAADKQLEVFNNNNTSILKHRTNAQTFNNLNQSYILSSASVTSARNTKRLPFPIIDKSQKSIVDKMVDYLVGDGISNRFAMICQQCFKHNGKLNKILLIILFFSMKY